MSVDLTPALLEAARNAWRWSPDELERTLGQIRDRRRNVRIDWDRDSGECWASLIKGDKVLGFLHARLPLGMFIEGVDDELASTLEKSLGLVVVRSPGYEDTIFEIQREAMPVVFPGIVLRDDWEGSGLSVWDIWYDTIMFGCGPDSAPSPVPS